MKKLNYLFVVLGLLAFIACGGGSSDEGSNETVPAPAAETVDSSQAAPVDSSATVEESHDHDHDHDHDH